MLMWRFADARPVRREHAEAALFRRSVEERRLRAAARPAVEKNQGTPGGFAEFADGESHARSIQRWIIRRIGDHFEPRAESAGEFAPDFRGAFDFEHVLLIGLVDQPCALREFALE